MTESTKSFVRALLPERRAAMAAALMLAVFAIGWRIPLPGLDLDRFLPLDFRSGDVAARLSIFALGVFPLFTILAHVEFAKLVFPPLAKWQTDSSGNARRLAVIVLAMSLLLVAWQGHGVLMALEAGAGVRPDAIGFVPVGLASFIASMAVIIWLADGFRSPDLGDGFWLLMAIPLIADFPGLTFAGIQLVRIGAISASQLLIVGLAVAAAMALVVFANLLLSMNGRSDGVERTSILLWPPHLANVLAGYAFLALPTYLVLPAQTPIWPFVAPSFPQVILLAFIVVCIPILVFAYARSFRLSRREDSGLWPTPVLLGVAAIQIILCLGATLLPAYWGLPPNVSGGDLLIVGTVMLALRRPLSLSLGRTTATRTAER